MRQLTEKKFNKIMEPIEDLDNLFTERIEDLYEVKGGMQARHAYILYRNILWGFKYKLLKTKKVVNVDKVVESVINDYNTEIMKVAFDAGREIMTDTQEPVYKDADEWVNKYFNKES